MATKINSYAELQAYITDWLTAHGVDASGAPHGTFWNNMSYEDFTTKTVPGFKSVKILIVGDGKGSNIVQALMGVGLFDPNTGRYGQMPAGGPFMQPAGPVVGPVVKPIVDWIDSGCPQ
jgi:hypothetical protein